MTTPTRVATVTLSASAAKLVRDLLKERELGEEYALRVYVSGRTCSGFQYGMALDNKPGETDSQFESQGLRLLIDDVSMQHMAGASIDYIDDERGKGFLVDNPNPVPACSCGNSSCEN
jgi:iron-sulfur cluster assembly protein